MLAKRSLANIAFPSLLCTTALMAGWLAGCKGHPARPTPASVPASKAVVDLSSLSDDQLAATTQKDGLGLGLRIPGGNTFHAAKGFPLHVIIEDFAARQPIAAGMCEGFFIAYEDAATQESSTDELATNPRCNDVNPYPDSVALTQGKPKSTDVNTETATHITFAPGNYLIHIEWRAYPAGAGTIAVPQPYTTLESNVVPVTIVP